MSTIKANTIQPLTDGDSVKIRTNAQDSLTVDTNGNLTVRSNVAASTIDITGGVTAAGAARFNGGVTASVLDVTGALRVGALSTFAGITSSAILSCATVPTQGQHLTNKTYVDNTASAGGNVDFVYMGYDGQATAVQKSITLKAGRWLAVANGHCNFTSDASTGGHSTFQTISCSELSYSSQLQYDKQRTGGAGFGRYTYASSTTAVQITVSTAGTYTFTIGAYSSSAYTERSRGTTLVLHYMGP